jgi:hypothetical protein
MAYNQMNIEGKPTKNVLRNASGFVRPKLLRILKALFLSFVSNSAA